MLSDDDITVKAMLISQTPGIGISTLWSAIFDIPLKLTEILITLFKFSFTNQIQ